MTPFPENGRTPYKSMQPETSRKEDHITDNRFTDIEDVHDLKDLLVNLGLLTTDAEFTQDDANAVLIRANKAYSQEDDKMALGFAFLDRMAATKPGAFPTLESIDPETIQKMLRERGRVATKEDIGLMLTFGRSGTWKYGENGIVDQWLALRVEAEQNINELSGVVDHRQGIVDVKAGDVNDAKLMMDKQAKDV